MFADPRTYVTNRYEIGMQGAAWGRSQVLNRVGVPVADTGYEDGVATAVLDLSKRKEDPYAPWYQGENTFFTNCLGDRTAFQPLTETWTPPRVPSYRKRQARIAVIAQGSLGIWRNGAAPERMLELLDSFAAAVKPDLVLLTEMAANVTKPGVREGMEEVARRARALGAYVVIGGLGDEEFLSIARVWDREGQEVFAEPIYWTRGFPKLSVFDTDFARVGIHTCGDLYTGEIDRVLALKGAELILDPSQYWGAGGENDAPILQARAADNGCWVACAHWNTSDAAHRSVIVDPYGTIVAASQFQREGVIHADVPFDDARVYYAGRKPEQPTPGSREIPSYYTGDLPEQRHGWREMLFPRRRPELYGILPTVNEVTMKYRPAHNPWDEK
jgi:predicted amidohydrolase